MNSLPLSTDLAESEVVLHAIDPNGEVVITLLDANAPFAIWGQNQPINGNPFEIPQQTPTDSVNEQTKSNKVRYQVSARHLTLASPVFAKALSPRWKEGSTLQDQGIVEITVDGWDSEALLILLNIFHCQFPLIPREISTELLAKIAVLADYYQCLDTINMFADMWIKAMVQPILVTYGRDLMLWLFIRSLFGPSNECRKLARVAVRHSTDGIPSLGLPFSISIIAGLNGKREKAITHILDALHSKIDHMRRFNDDGIDSKSVSFKPSADPTQFTPFWIAKGQFQSTCFDCTSSKLGALLKQMTARSLFPKPKSPYYGLSPSGLMASIGSFRQSGRTAGHENCVSFSMFMTHFTSELWAEVDQILTSEP